MLYKTIEDEKKIYLTNLREDACSVRTYELLQQFVCDQCVHVDLSALGQNPSGEGTREVKGQIHLSGTKECAEKNTRSFKNEKNV